LAAPRRASRYAGSTLLLRGLPGIAAERVLQERRARLAGQVGERLAQRAARGLVGALRGGGELLVGVDTEDDAARFRRLGRERLYAKFHGESIA